MVSHLVRKSKKRTQKLHQDPSAACEQVTVKGSQLSASYGSQMALNRSRSANIILPCMSDMGHSCRARVCKCHDVLIACSCHSAPHSKVFYLFSLSCSLVIGSDFLYVWNQQLKSGTAQEESLSFCGSKWPRGNPSVWSACTHRSRLQQHIKKTSAEASNVFFVAFLNK